MAVVMNCQNMRLIVLQCLVTGTQQPRQRAGGWPALGRAAMTCRSMREVVLDRYQAGIKDYRAILRHVQCTGQKIVDDMFHCLLVSGSLLVIACSSGTAVVRCVIRMILNAFQCMTSQCATSYVRDINSTQALCFVVECAGSKPH